ncbi:MAG: twin-arginine translocation signal domain-containing protein [Thermodesulfobacteriota bacterium]
MNRRSFIQFLAALGAATSSGFIWPRQVKAAQPDLEVDLRAVQDRVPLFSGPPTNVWRFICV